ncbi:hypothetical protein [Thalassotalea agariperforans]
MDKIEKMIHWGATLLIPILLFLLAPIWGALFEKNKAIEYAVVAEQKIFDHNMFNDQLPESKFNHGGLELKEVFITTIMIANTGKTPIRSNDFESSIKFEIELEKGIMTSKVSKSFPKELPVNIKTEEGAIIIEPLLLNPNDRFYIELLTETKIAIKKASVRIVGLDNIIEKEVDRYSGLMLELIEPGDTISSTSQRHLMPISGYALIVISLVSGLCTFLFLFASGAYKNRAIKSIFLALAFIMYIVSLSSSKFLPEAYFGSSSEKWMDYVSMFILLIAGAALAVWLRSNLGVIRLRSDVKEQGE